MRTHKVNIKERPPESKYLVPKIYREEMGSLLDRQYKFVVDVPILSWMTFVLYRNKCQHQGDLSEPNIWRKVNLLPFYLQTMEMVKFCNFKIQLFLCTTFTSSGKQFVQLYAIDTDIRNKCQETIVFLVFLALF